MLNHSLIHSLTHSPIHTDCIFIASIIHKSHNSLHVCIRAYLLLEGGRSYGRDGGDSRSGGGNDNYGRGGGGNDNYGRSGSGNDNYGRSGGGNDNYGRSGSGNDNYGRSGSDDRRGNDNYGRSGSDDRRGNDNYGRSGSDDRRGNDNYGRSGGNDSYGRDRDSRGGNDSYGRDRDSRGGYNSGRGGYGGGRGGGRGGRGGGGGRPMYDGPRLGPNNHLGQMAIAQTLLANSEDPESIKAVVYPPKDSRIRTIDVAKFPKHENWRLSPAIGAQTQVTANFFKMDPTKIPPKVYHYHLSVFKGLRGTEEFTNSDVSANPRDCDMRVLISLVKQLRSQNPNWICRQTTGEPVGFTYDGASTVLTTSALFDTQEHEEAVDLDGRGWTLKLKFCVEISMPTSTVDWQLHRSTEDSMRAINSAITNFARMQISELDQTWFIDGYKAFRANGKQTRLSESFVSMQGYYSSFKVCMAGLLLCTDMVVSSFLNCGELIDVMAFILGMDRDEFLKECQEGNINSSACDRLTKQLKSAKVRLKHVRHWKKIQSVQCSADKYMFELSPGQKISVSEYYEEQAKNRADYIQHMKNGKLAYAYVPTVDVGKKDKPVIIPAELVVVISGQSRPARGNLTAALIKAAAVRPNERFEFIRSSTGSTDLITSVRSDETACAFGLIGIDPSPMSVPCKLLPPAKLQYANMSFEPKLEGTWNLSSGQQFAAKPVANMYDNRGRIVYGVLVCQQERDCPPAFMNNLDVFLTQFDQDASACGMSVSNGGPVIHCQNFEKAIEDNLKLFKMNHAKFVLVVLNQNERDDMYPSIKLRADSMLLVTQCLKFKNIMRIPSGFQSNILLKINTKLGGTNHTLASRSGGKLQDSKYDERSTFQTPPDSISWVFDEPTMLVGIDVCHPDKKGDQGSRSASVAAIVGSMNRTSTIYGCYIANQAAKTEIVSGVTDGFFELLQEFKNVNGVLPKNIIVFRDGVSEGQFRSVLSDEIEAIYNAINQHGCTNDSIKLCVIICSKHHNTRLAYENIASGTGSNAFINVCPGICIDGSSGDMSITSNEFNEFYLCSQVALQGTAKPCKYTVLYDTIGFKIAEIELITYWSTYLYCRCNKSIGVPAPAKYAHWAAKRGRNLVQAGARAGELISITKGWRELDNPMFFV